MQTDSNNDAKRSLLPHVLFVDNNWIRQDELIFMHYEGENKPKNWVINLFLILIR